MRLWKFLLIGILIFGALSFATGPEESSAKQPIVAEKEVNQILERSCFDCHSDSGKTPWYGYIFPVSLYLAYHRREAKEELNFSVWEEYSAKKKSSLLSTILEEIEEGEMPLPEYLWMHKQAIVKEADLDLLRNWAKQSEGENEKE